MITPLYAALCACLICWLSFNVIKARRKNKVKYGDGGKEDLLIARSAQSNAIEYIPLSLILLFMLEFNQAPLWLIHAIGIVFLLGRIIHARALLSDQLRQRVLGMQITFNIIFILIIANLFFLPHEKLLPF